MKIGLFTEFSYPGKSEHQTYADVLEQIALADELGYDFFSTTESYGKDLFSCSPFPLGLYVAAAQRTRRIRFLTGIVSAPIHHPAVLASEIAAADLLTRAPDEEHGIALVLEAHREPVIDVLEEADHRDRRRGTSRRQGGRDTANRGLRRARVPDRRRGSPALLSDARADAVDEADDVVRRIPVAGRPAGGAGQGRQLPRVRDRRGVEHHMRRWQVGHG